MKIWFWILWSFDAAIGAVALYFFFSLGAHGRVGSFNILPWMAILAALAAVVGGSAWLRSPDSTPLPSFFFCSWQSPEGCSFYSSFSS